MSAHSPERTDDGKQPVWYRQHSTDTPDMHDLGELPPELALAVDNSLVRLNAIEEVVEASVALREANKLVEVDHSLAANAKWSSTVDAWVTAVDNWKAVR